MILYDDKFAYSNHGIPRMSGDDPGCGKSHRNSWPYSPHERG